MPLLVPYGNELIRINPANNRIEYSTNRGASWISRYSGSNCGTFRDLIPYGGKLLALTDKGVIKVLPGLQNTPASMPRPLQPFRTPAENFLQPQPMDTFTIQPTKERPGFVASSKTQY